MAREWRVSSFPGFHNFLVNIGGQVIAGFSGHENKAAAEQRLLRMNKSQ